MKMAHNAFRRSSDNHDVDNPSTLVEGNTLILKLNGVSAGGKAVHYEITSDGGSCLQIKTKTPAGQLEQIIYINVGPCVSQTHFTVRATLPKDAKTNGKALPVIPLEIKVVPEIVLPEATTDAGLIARVLLSEALGPEMPGYKGGATSRESMDLMRQVLDNRLYAAKTKLAYAVNLTKQDGLYSVVTAPKQIDGFEGGISENTENRVQKIIGNANNGTYRKFKEIRAHVEYALKVAKRQPSLPSRITASTLTHWRTNATGAPTGNSVKSIKVGGQQFWTLSGKFLKDNPQ
jgi:hypothetical protein